MAKRPYDETSVIRTLTRKRSIHVDAIRKKIIVSKNATGQDAVGNNSWGKIDYLVNHCGYVYGFSASGKSTTSVEEIVDNTSKKQIKRERKINMAANTKATMKAARNY